MSIVPKYLAGTLFDTRTVVVNSTIYFCAKDVAEMLKYANTKNACSNNDVKAKYRRPLHEIIEASQLPPNERNSILSRSLAYFTGLPDQSSRKRNPFKIGCTKNVFQSYEAVFSNSRLGSRTKQICIVKSCHSSQNTTLMHSSLQVWASYKIHRRKG